MEELVKQVLKWWKKSPADEAVKIFREMGEEL